MKSRLKLSVVVATFNESSNIYGCLSSIHSIADEIIVVDGGSKDKTVSIARTFTKNIYITSNPRMFHINKQKAITHARGEWILQLDADEVIPENLSEEIVTKINSNFNNTGYAIARKNYFCGRWMKHGGMYPDYVIRLFKNGKGYFPCESVHEQIVINGSIGYLKNPMIHMSYHTFGEYVKKADRYTNLTAEKMKGDCVKKDIQSLMTYYIFLPTKTFINLYFRHRGFLDGWWGFVWAFFSGAHFFQAYRKYLHIHEST